MWFTSIRENHPHSKAGYAGWSNRYEYGLSDALQDLKRSDRIAHIKIIGYEGY